MYAIRHVLTLAFCTLFYFLLNGLVQFTKLLQKVHSNQTALHPTHNNAAPTTPAVSVRRRVLPSVTG